MMPSFRSLAAVAFTFVIAGCAAEEEDVVAIPTLAGVDTESSAHLKGGKSAEPSFVDLGLALSASAAVSGLGNGHILVHLDAVGQPFATCTNPAGANQPAGQNPAEVTLSGTQAIPSSQIKNGTVSFGLTTGAPASVVAGAPGCPNPQWTETITDVSFSSATITVEQGGATVLSLHCTFSPSTANGAVSASAVTCSSN